MKTKFSKKLLSFFLAVMMIATSIPMAAFTASAAENSKFLMAYFTGNGNAVTSQQNTQAIRFAVSTDGLNFTPLNNNISVIKQTQGRKNCRDPYLFKGNDAYYIIATDMDSVNNSQFWNNSNTFVIWKSTDLINWTDETIISLPGILNYSDGDVWRAWAPQIAWDADAGKYMVYFALAAKDHQDYGDNYNTHMYYMYCDDLMKQDTYSQPQPLFDIGNNTKDGNAYSFNNIDADITYDSATDKYYMFYKDERDGQKYILYATSDKLNGPYAGTTKISSKQLEGCQLYSLNDGSYILASDDYGNNGHFVLYHGNTINDIATGNYTTRSEDFGNCSVRHGSFLKISDEQYNALLAKDWSSAADPNGEGVDLTSDLIAQYLVKDTTTDETGNNHNLSANGNVSWNSTGYENSLGTATFTADNYLYSSDLAGILSSANAENGITISFLANPGSNNSWASTDGGGRFFELTNMGTKGSLVYETNRAQAKYVSMNFNSHIEIINGYDSFNQAGDGTLYAEQWHNYTVTMTTTSAILYIDGIKSCTVDNTQFSDIFTAWKSNGYLLLGASAWGDTTLNGSMRDVRVYGRAITEDEASRLPMQYMLDYQPTVKEAKDLLNQFETLMSTVSTSKAYTNMGSAYEAYVNLNKAIDSYYYGNDHTVNLLRYTGALKAAIANMQEISNYIATANYQPGWGTTGNYVDENAYYSNVLWADRTLISSNNDNYVDSGYMQTKSWANKTSVMLYDGVNPTIFPVTFQLVRSGALRRNLQYFLLYSTSYNTIGTWKGYMDSEWQKWPNVSSTEISNTSSSNSSLKVDNSTARFFKNGESYTGTGDTVNYYELSNSMTHRHHSSSNQNGDTTLPNTVYTLNYSVLRNNLSSKFMPVQSKFVDIAHNVKQYSEGGAMDIFSLADCIVDPTVYNYSSNTDAVVKEVASLLKAKSEKISSLNGLTSAYTATVNSTDYADLRAEMDKYSTNIIGDYTVASLDEYTAIYKAAQTVMADVIKKGYVNESKCTADVTAMQNVLNTEKDKADLYTALSSKNNSTSIFDATGKQVYTLSDYDKFAESLAAEKNTVDSTTYYTKNVVAGNYSSISDDKLPYNQTTTNSEAYNNELTKINDMAISGGVDKGYDNFDAALIVAGSIDRNKYTEEALTIFDAIIAEQEAVAYTTVTTELAEKYSPMLDGVNKVKALSTGVDECTKAVLEAINNLETEKLGDLTETINRFTSYITIQDENSNASVVHQEVEKNVKYGDTFTIDAADFDQLKDAENINWGITLYEKGSDIAVGSQRVSSYDGRVLERVANYDIHVTAEIKNTQSDEPYYILKFLNGYGNVFEIKYFDHEPTADDTKGVTTSLPFYTFSKWSEAKKTGENEYTVSPVFDAAKYVNIDVIGGTTSKAQPEMNKTATVTADDTTNMIGWAVKNGSKYQVVAYGTEPYSFVAVASETYCPIYFDGTSYTANGVTLTADTLDYGANTYSKPADVTTIDTQEFINSKLAAQSPFVYVQAVDRTSTADKTKVVIRVTKNSNASNILAYGLAATGVASDGTVKQNFYKSTTKNEAGQVTMTVKNTTFAKYTSFGGFVTYTYSYADKGVTANVNTTDIYVNVK